MPAWRRSFCVLEGTRRPQMRHYPHAVGVRLVDDGPVHARFELRYSALSVVDPDLHEVHTVRAELLDGGPTLGLGLRPSRDPEAILLLGTCHRCCGGPPTRREKARRVRDHLVAQLERQRLVLFETQAHRGRDTVIRKPFEVFDEILPRVVFLAARSVLYVRKPEVLMCVDQCGDHGLPCQVHPLGTVRRLPFARSAHPGDGAVLDEECGVLRGGAAITGDQPCSLEPDRIPRSLSRPVVGRAGNDQEQEARPEGCVGDSSSLIHLPSSRQESPRATGRSSSSPFAACFRGGATVSRPYSG